MSEIQLESPPAVKRTPSKDGVVATPIVVRMHMSETEQQHLSDSDNTDVLKPSPQTSPVTTAAAVAPAANTEYSKLEKFMHWDVYTRLDLHVQSAWPGISENWFFVWKVFAWAWWGAMWLMSLSLWDSPRGKFFAYLTCWNLSAVTIYFCCSFYLGLRHFLAKREAAANGKPYDYTPSNRLLRFTFGVYEHAFSWTVLVVLVYWATIYPSSVHPTAYDRFDNSVIHAIIIGFTVGDLCLSRLSFVLTHTWYTMAISIIYLIVNGVYCAIAGGYIYSILDWSKGFTAAVIIVCAAFLVGMYAIGHLIEWKRDDWSGNEPLERSKFCTCRRQATEYMQKDVEAESLTVPAGTA